MKTGEEQGLLESARIPDWSDDEQVRHRRLREDAKRSLAENLAEGLALSEFLSTFTGAARPR